MQDSELNQSVLPLVTESEAGQKLLRFLERRLRLPRNLLHRWLRTGQIRLNGKRSKPFDPVAVGDLVRVPPFARKLAQEEAGCEGDLPPLLGKSGAIWAFNKPSGLATQPGTGHALSLSGLLRTHYRDADFCPAPAHRLDLETSGVLLVGATYAALSELQRMFAMGQIHKEYLAWVKGAVPWSGERLLRHYLSGDGQISAGPGGSEALCVARPLRVLKERTLMQIRLLTGRKRQIRSQLAACGFPIIGDRRHGDNGGCLKLHACRAILPDGATFACLPPWQDEFAVAEMPPIMAAPPSNSKETVNL